MDVAASRIILMIIYGNSAQGAHISLKSVLKFIAPPGIPLEALYDATSLLHKGLKRKKFARKLPKSNRFTTIKSGFRNETIQENTSEGFRAN